MGLDSVELVIEVEERFGVAISDGEAAEVRTVGDLLDVLERRVKRSEFTPVCPSLGWFLRLRRVARRVTENGALRPRPNDRIEAVLTRGADRKRLWAALEENAALPRSLLNTPPQPASPRSTPSLCLPPLCRPRGATATLVVLGIVALLSFVLAPFVRVSVFNWLAMASIPALLLTWVATKPLATHPPEGYATFGELTRRLVAREMTVVGFPPESRELLLLELQPIVSNQLGVDIDEVTPEARFVEDLGMA